jgi:hypothetical protein
MVRNGRDMNYDSNNNRNDDGDDMDDSELFKCNGQGIIVSPIIRSRHGHSMLPSSSLNHDEDNSNDYVSSKNHSVEEQVFLWQLNVWFIGFIL